MQEPSSPPRRIFSSPGNTRFLLALILFTATAWLYAPTTGGGFLTRMDDDEYFAQAARAHGLGSAGLHWAFTATAPYYHPLPRLSFLLDYDLWGDNPAGWHAVNAGLHALNAACLFGLLGLLLGAVTAWRPGERAAVAFGVAAVFAVHPLQVESVAWIASRVQLLSTLFSLACLWACLAGAGKGAETGANARVDAPARRWLAALPFAAALLCKPTAVSLIFAVLAIDALRRRPNRWAGWLRLLAGRAELIVLAGLAAGATLLTESHSGGLLQPLEAVRPLQRIALVVQSLAFYPWKLAWPVGLCPYYPLGLGFSLQPGAVAAAALAVAAAAALALAARRRAPALAAGFAVYALFILPVSGLTLRGWQAAADRYAYVALVPLLLLAGAGAVRLWRRTGPATRTGLACLGAAAFLLLGGRTRRQEAVWHSDATLWSAVVARYPDSAAANAMLAQTDLNENRIDAGLACARRAALDQPCAETRRNLGIALTRAGRPAEAVDELEAATRLDPSLADAQSNLALTLASLGRMDEAVGRWREAVRLEPDNADSRCGLGIALERTGALDEAAGQFERALQLQPHFAEAHYNLGVVLAHQDRVPEAVRQWEEAIRIRPDYAEAQCNLGVALEQSGQLPEAAGHYEEALRLRPDLASVHYNLGNVLLQLHREAGAMAQWEESLRLDPSNASAEYNLGVLLEKAGRAAEAIVHYEAAVRLRPDFQAAQERLMTLQFAR